MGIGGECAAYSPYNTNKYDKQAEKDHDRGMGERNKPECHPSRSRLQMWGKVCRLCSANTRGVRNTMHGLPAIGAVGAVPIGSVLCQWVQQADGEDWLRQSTHLFYMVGGWWELSTRLPPSSRHTIHISISLAMLHIDTLCYTSATWNNYAKAM